MRSLKRTILAAALLISFSAAGATLGNDVSAASLQAAEPAGPVSNTGRDYRIALINAENSRGPVIHKPLKEEKGTDSCLPFRKSHRLQRRQHLQRRCPFPPSP